MMKKILLFFLPLLLIASEQDTEKIKKRLEELRGKELSILEEIEKIDYEIFLMEKEIENLKAKERLFSELLKKKEEDLERVRADFRKERDKLKSLLSAIYMFRYFSPLELILRRSGSLEFSDISRVIYLSHWRKERLNKIELVYRELQKKESELRKTRDDYKKAIQSKEYKLQELNSKKREKKKVIENLGKEKESYFSLLKEMEKASQAISEKIFSEKPLEFSYPSVSIRERKGALPWPVEGEVIQKFGLVKNKKYNTFVKNIGLVLSSRDEDVRAVWWGRVIFADYFEGYGNVIIIEHQDRVYSIYGYLGTIYVKKGDQVTTGQIIAKVGSSGIAHEGSLYFEIREGNEPKNPLLWLSKK